MLLLLLFIIK